MSTMTLDRWLAEQGLAADQSLPPVPVSGVALDTRELRAGDVFLALRGGSDHGLRHAQAAIDRGAVAIVAEAPLPEQTTTTFSIPVVAVPALRAHAGALAERIYRSASAALTVFGVTGTNGKTSTVQFIAQAAQVLGHRPATLGTLGVGPIGQMRPQARTTPDVCSTHRYLAECRDQGCDWVAMEVSSHALDQGRVDGVHFDVAVYTQLSRDHLDYHGSMEAYFEAKAKLFSWPDLRAAVINLDCPWGLRLLPQLAADVAVHGYSASGAESASITAEDVKLDHQGMHFTLCLGHERYPVRTALMGRFNVDNVLAASGALLAAGAEPAHIAAALAQLQPVPGRMNRLGGDKQPLVVVDYAHTPDAISKALSALREHQPRVLSIVFGCGGERDRGKRPQMAAAAEAGADRVYVTDDNPRGEDGDSILSDIRVGFTRLAAVREQRNRRLAIESAIADAGPGDIVLIAGKGHETYQDVGGRMLAFDDRAVAAELLMRRAA
jgi:UDP-N-acetylmuramoyl-L-alanyl-D-glutamate--2,6-diaminopimelate ligase